MIFKKTPIAAALLLQLGSCLLSYAHAEDPRRALNIPAGPLSTALNRLAEASNLQLVYDTDMAQGLTSSALNGTYTPEAALQKLLQGSGLSYRLSGGNTVLIARQTPATQAQAAPSTKQPLTLPPVRVSGKAEYAATDPYNTDYHHPNAVTATKTDTPIMETPYSVTIVPKEILKDQQVIKIDDAVKNVAGVMAQPTNGQTSDSFIIRGFQNDNVYRNGFLLPSALGGGTSKRETANLESIEVLKGPGSILYGRSEPGGIINLVTKKPQATPYYSLQQQFGSYDFYRTTGDATGAITHDDSLLYRFNFAYENSGSFRDFQKADKIFIAPSFTWNVSDQTQINFDIEHQYFDETGDSGQTPLLINVPTGSEPVNNRPAPIPRSRELGEYVNNSSIGDRTYVGFDWSHAFNDQWKLSQRFGAEFWDLKSKYLFFYPGADALGNLSRSFNNGETQQQQYSTSLNLTGKFDTGVIGHTLLTGFDYFVVDNQGPGNCCQYAGDFNIFNPTYLTQAPSFDPANNSNIQGITQDWYSLYIQDQVKLPYNVFANFGLRYDDASSHSVVSWNGFEPVDTDHNHVSPRGGLLWKPVGWLSLYGSYTENFGQNNSLWDSPGQKAVGPQTAEQWEMGTKTEFFDGRLAATFAYFDLTKQNIAIVDYSTLPYPTSKTIGEQESRGYEFEASGEILPGWKLIGAYTHLAYANINKDGLDGKSDNTGHRMMLAPRNFGSLWSTYEWQAGQLRGLKFGGGVAGADLSQGNSANDYQLPGYMTLNLLASYAIKVGDTKATLQLNVNNLLDKTYYTGSNTAYQIGVGAPRSFMGSVKVEF